MTVGSKRLIDVTQAVQDPWEDFGLHDHFRQVDLAAATMTRNDPVSGPSKGGEITGKSPIFLKMTKIL